LPQRSPVPLAVNVYLRDTQHLVEVLLTAGSGRAHRLLVPAHHLGPAASPSLVWLYFLNPVTPLVMTFQRVLYNIRIAPVTRRPHTHRVPPAVPWTTYALQCIILAVSVSC